MSSKHWRQQLRAEFPDGRIPPHIHNQVVREIKTSRKFTRQIAGIYRVPARLVVTDDLGKMSRTYRQLRDRRMWADILRAFSLAAERVTKAFVGFGNVFTAPAGPPNPAEFKPIGHLLEGGIHFEPEEYIHINFPLPELRFRPVRITAPANTNPLLEQANRPNGDL